MLSDVAECLACPHCHAVLVVDERAARCANGHAFDVARQGYVNLLPGDARPGSADTAEMVDARDRFLLAGHYAPIAEAVASAVDVALAPDVPGCVVDAGAGTGYHLARVLDRLPARAGVALDLSKHAMRRAARAHPRIGAVVGDVWARLPVRDGAAAVVLDVFAPRNAAEFRRILHPRGVLAVVTPTSRHLHAIVASLGLLTVDERKRERLDEQMGGRFIRVRDVPCEYDLALTRSEVTAIVSMGPSARHIGTEELLRRTSGLAEPVRARVSCVVSVFEPL